MLNLSAVKTAKKEPAIVKPKADAPKKRGRPKGSKKRNEQGYCRICQG